MKNRYKILLLVLTMGVLSCTEDYLIESGPASGVVNMSSYDFLSSNPDNFSELVKVINRTGRKALINQDNITLFALQNESILTYLGSQDYRSVEEANLTHLDSLLQKYVIEDDKLMRSNIESGLGIDLVTANTLNMNVRTTKGEYKGVQDVGAVNIIYTDADFLASLREQKQSTTPAETFVTTGDIQTTNAVIHVITKDHKFGF